MAHLPRLTTPRLSTEDDFRKALIELIDRVNQLVEELNRREEEDAHTH